MKSINKFIHIYFYAFILFTLVIISLSMFVLTGQSICVFFGGLFSGLCLYNAIESYNNEVLGTGDSDS